MSQEDKKCLNPSTNSPLELHDLDTLRHQVLMDYQHPTYMNLINQVYYSNAQSIINQLTEEDFFKIGYYLGVPPNLNKTVNLEEGKKIVKNFLELFKMYCTTNNYTTVNLIYDYYHEFYGFEPPADYYIPSNQVQNSPNPSLKLQNPTQTGNPSNLAPNSTPDKQRHSQMTQRK